MSSKPPQPPHRQIVTEQDRVKVIVRVRPSTTNDASAMVIKFDEKNAVCDGSNFDCVLGPQVTQDHVFNQVVPVIDTFLTGYNATIFSYGQTASGKTHTMVGSDGGKQELSGVIPKTVEYALKRLAQEKIDRMSTSGSSTVIWNARLQASYVELYNEALRDLIRNDDNADTVDQNPPQVREDGHGNVFLSGATKITIHSAEELLQLIKLGSRRRAMGRTNMNEFSSRSHAVLSLYLECRWKDASTAQGAVKSSVSVLQLVDLAGSEYAKKTGNDGLRMKESIAINTGLFTLGCVIASLSGHRDRRVGNHIPYRDSLLTRLLQSALGGDARTALIVCVSPDASNLAETRSSLQYASTARKISNVSKQHVEEVKEEIEGPYYLPGDIADPIAETDRRVLYVETEFGDVFCRVLGDLDDDVILFVHGSGPTNSSAFWNSIIWETYCRVPDRSYCYVSMDCPGYGRSQGDRQAIRSSPGELIRAVLYGLGKKDALCLVGSSQGCCAIFNAALQCPRICRRLCGIHPVGHDPSRYTSIRQPTLLTFDVEDAGHPVSVGRIMKKNLPFCMYHEYECSKSPYWESENTAKELIKLIDWNAGPGAVSIQNPFAAAAAGGSNFVRARGLNKRPEQASKKWWTLAGGICAWCESNGLGEECYDLCYMKKPSTFLAKEIADAGLNDDDRLTISSSASDTFSFKTDTTDSVWNAFVDDKTQRVYYVNSKSKETKFKRPLNGKIVVRGASNNNNNGGGAVACCSNDNDTNNNNNALFDDEYQESDDLEGEISEAQMNARLVAELEETKCSCCGNFLWRPERGRNCRHAVCQWCNLTLGNIHQKCCPTCKAKPFESVGEEVLVMHQVALAKNLEISTYGANSVDLAVALRKSLPSITLEYGNTAEGSAGASFVVSASIKATKIFKGSPSISSKFGVSLSNATAANAIAKVGFDINPDFPKSAVKVLQPPFKLDRDMSTPFTCAMQVNFSAPNLSWLTLIIPYAIHHVKDFRERVVVYLCPDALFQTTRRELFESQPPHFLQNTEDKNNGNDDDDDDDDDEKDGGKSKKSQQVVSNAAIIHQVVAKSSVLVKNKLPTGWHRLPAIDYDECAVTECFVTLK